jgi:hypothetical protein
VYLLFKYLKNLLFKSYLWRNSFYFQIKLLLLVSVACPYFGLKHGSEVVVRVQGWIGIENGLHRQHHMYCKSRKFQCKSIVVVYEFVYAITAFGEPPNV